MMKRTTLVLDERNFTELKSLAAAQRRTLTELVNEILQAGLRQLRRRKKARKLSPLPTYPMGPFLVDISDRDALYRAMEGR